VTETLVLPRIGSVLELDRPTLGPFLVDVLEGLGYQPHAWQSYASDVSLQLRRRTKGRGRRAVSPWRLQAQTATVMVGRQSGKTAWDEARAVLQCLLPDLDGVAEMVGGRVGPQNVGWLAQDRAGATRTWLPMLERLIDSRYRELLVRPKLQRADESIRFHNGSSLEVVTPSRTGPRGRSLDLIVLDEALAHPLELMSSLAPTQAARDGARWSIGSQFVATSSAPDDDRKSGLLVSLREQGRRAVAEGDPSVCWLEWSAEEGADPYDEAQWAIACPTLGQPNGITVDYLRLQAETLDRDAFAVEYLSMPGLGPASRCIDVDAWARAPQLSMGDRVVLAVDGRPNSLSASIVAASRVGDRYTVEVVELNAGVDWVEVRVLELARRWGARVVIDRAGPLGWLIPVLQQAKVNVVAATASDVLTAAAGFAVAVANGLVAHPRDPRLDEAVEAAVRRRSGDRWAFDRSCPVDLSPLVAASLGVWVEQHRRAVVPRIF
jgi:hypothetical protein